MVGRARGVDRQIKFAAPSVGLFGAALVLEAMGVGLRESWLDRRHLAVHLGGGAMWAGIAWAIHRRRRWAWTATVFLGTPLFLLGGANLLFVLREPALSGLSRRAIRPGVYAWTGNGLIQPA